MHAHRELALRAPYIYRRLGDLITCDEFRHSANRLPRELKPAGRQGRPQLFTLRQTLAVAAVCCLTRAGVHFRYVVPLVVHNLRAIVAGKHVFCLGKNGAANEVVSFDCQADVQRIAEKIAARSKTHVDQVFQIVDARKLLARVVELYATVPSDAILTPEMIAEAEHELARLEANLDNPLPRA
jgi:hypothetical protein